MLAGARRRGAELTADPVSDSVDETPTLLVMLRMLGERERPAVDPVRVTPVEARILALLAGGATTARAARETGLTSDGVTYHCGGCPRGGVRATVRNWSPGPMRWGC
ncbi:hypothetical protein QF037_001445 [Streptomyces canus]|nr:hypothetical protein [Streptomyces canus]